MAATKRQLAGIAIGGSSLCWTETGSTITNTGAVVSAPLDGGAAVTIAS
jgi:hypothetical protein